MISQMTNNMIKHLADTHDADDDLGCEITRHLVAWSTEDLVELCDELDNNILQDNYYLIEGGGTFNMSELIRQHATLALSFKVTSLINKQGNNL